MGVIADVGVRLPWPYLNGEPQFECANPSNPGRQLTIETVNGEPALKLLVDDASKYGASTWYRALGRLTAPGDRRFGPGSTVGVVKRLMIPAGQVLQGATVIDEPHGAHDAVAPVRLIVRPDQRLYVSFNGGARNAVGGYSGWEQEQSVGPFTFGVEHVLEYEITFSPDRAVGRCRVILDGAVVHDEQHATAQTINGVYQYPYLLTGIYVGNASTPVVCFVKRVVVADTLAEARAAFAPEPEPEPPVDPCASLRVELAAEQLRSVGLTEELDATRQALEAERAVIVEIRGQLRDEIAALRETLSWQKVKKRAVWAAYRLAGGQ